MPEIYSNNWDDKSKNRVSLEDLKKRIEESIEAVEDMVKNKKLDILDFTALKFAKTATWPDPVKKKNECNFVEFINQLFTTVASVKAIEYLVEKSCLGEKNKWKMCLGTTPGRDLTVYDGKSPKIIAEIFAVTDPSSNSKLKGEILSLAKDKNVDRYAFFILAVDNFKDLTKKAKGWTAYTPTQKKDTGDKQTDKKPPIVADKMELNIDGDTPPQRATWTCTCNEKMIHIVCWSSEGCLNEFMTRKQCRSI